MNQYTKLYEIREAIYERGEQLIVGEQVSFVTAWEFYPYLRINSSRTTDYIDGTLEEKRERPEHGEWADPPEFGYLVIDQARMKEWAKRYLGINSSLNRMEV